MKLIARAFALAAFSLSLWLATASALAQTSTEEAEGHDTPPAAPGVVREPPPQVTTDSDSDGADRLPESDNGKVVEAPADGVAGWYPDEGFVVKSGDGQYKLHVGIQAGYRFSPTWLDGEPQARASFFVLRPYVSGTVFRDWISFWTSFEWGVTNPGYLLDSFVDITPWEEFGVRIGQQYTVMSRHEFEGPHQVLFPDWAMVANYFWPSRDRGITVMGRLLDKKLDYFAGLYSGTPLRQLTALAGTWHATARLTVNPMGDVAWNEFPYITSDTPVPLRVSFNLGGMAGDYEAAQENFNPGAFDFNVTATGERRAVQMGVVDFWLQGPRFLVFAEAYLRRSDYDDTPAFLSTGFWGQAGYMLVDRLLDIGARVNWLNPSDHLAHDMAYLLEGQLGYYPFKSIHLVARLRYGYGRQQTPKLDADSYAPVTLLLPPGTSHIATVQLMLAI